MVNREILNCGILNLKFEAPAGRGWEKVRGECIEADESVRFGRRIGIERDARGE
jgi:hypothetical protein